MQNIEFIPRLFLEILLSYCKLVIFGNLGMHGNTHKKNSITLSETLKSIYMWKQNLITLSFPEMLHFKESWNLIGLDYFGL